MKKTYEDLELEKMIRMQAENAQRLQKIITDGHALEKWVQDGHLEFIESKVFRAIEQKAFQTIKSPDFDPASVSQVAQLKALCLTLDFIRNDINTQLAIVKDARTTLNNLENSTPDGASQGEK